MERKKRLKPSKSTIGFIIFLVIFTIFLTQIPSMINDEDDFYSKPTMQTYGRTNDEMLKTKYQVITDTIMYELTNTKIQDSQSKYIVELTLANKIDNRENTIAQEIITLYEKNKTNEAKELSREIIEEKLTKFDEKEDWTWRNYLMYFSKNNENFILYNQSPILIEYNESEKIGFSSQNIRLYEFQLYEIELFDGSNETVRLNLLTNESEGDLSKYIDIETHEKNDELKSISSKFIESNYNHTITFIIWE
ncbi:MAG: hypothetical protein PF569_02005 [Candidatus Woesearchaeota archaeon]|jgi:hypothetical protein|nr:hypothetical protein [Candidatus Woesearchaeota archaeon]